MENSSSIRPGANGRNGKMGLSVNSVNSSSPLAENHAGDLQKAEEAVRLNSVVDLYDAKLERNQSVRIVMPDAVDLKNGCISVFSPLSVALLGQKVGDLVKLKTGGPGRELKIEGITNQMQ